MDRLDRTNRRLHRPSPGPMRLAMIAMTLCLGLPSQIARADRIEEVSIFGQAAGGFTHIVPNTGGETSKNGYHLLLTGFAEISSTNWVYQGGGGLFYSRIYSDGEKEFLDPQNNTVKQQKNLRIETRAGDIEIASRYKLTQVWEAGLMARALFGSSLSFSQNKDETTKYFAGPHVVYRMSRSSDFMRRIDMSLTTDLNVPQRRVYLLTAGFALGKTFHRDPEAPAPVPMPLPIPAPPPAPALPEDRFEEILADKVINFPSGSAVVQGAALPFLKELAGFLKANPKLWTQVDVEGHTDANGKLAYNMKLSKDRAGAVRKVLIDEGANASAIKAEGFGPTRPLVKEDSAEARATNRRVVMAFSVKGREERNTLSKKIKELRRKYFNE